MKFCCENIRSVASSTGHDLNHGSATGSFWQKVLLRLVLVKGGESNGWELQRIALLPFQKEEVTPVGLEELSSPCIILGLCWLPKFALCVQIDSMAAVSFRHNTND